MAYMMMINGTDVSRDPNNKCLKKFIRQITLGKSRISFDFDYAIVYDVSASLSLNLSHDIDFCDVV